MKLFIALLVSIILFACSDDKNNKSEKKDNKGKIEIKIPMSDGITLATDMFIPRGGGKFPTVLVRTPYGKWADEGIGKAFRLFRIAVVIQDVRGKHGSGGEFYPFINERSDGLQTLRWIRQQTWSNGKIAGWGGSYVGFTQWAISDSLDFLTLLITGANLYDFTYPDSLFSLQTAYIWGTQNASRDLNIISPEKMKSGIMTLPASAADDSTIKDIDFFNDWIKHDKYDEYWQKLNFRGKTKAPVLSLAGWYDLFLKAQIDDFEALSSNSPDSRLVIGPWCHGKQGELNEYGGLKRTGKPVKVFRYVKNVLKGKKSKLTSPLKDTKYNLFIMERNEYVGSDVWPPRETKITPYYIGPSGYLSTSAYKENGSIQYSYSPSDPYPSHGGTSLGDGVGPARQNENISRKDQIVFELPVQQQALTLLGPISATLWLSSSVSCTDFIVGLQDVFPDGKIINIQEGGAKVKFEGTEPRKSEISVWATGYQLSTGHKLRVFISSAWFPRYNRNLNNCETAATAVGIRDAEQRVYFGAEMPSSINLPIFE
jgi:uncharacterized protein